MIVALYEKSVFLFIEINNKLIFDKHLIRFLEFFNESDEQFVIKYKNKYPNYSIQIYNHRKHPLKRKVKLEIIEFTKNEKFKLILREHNLNNMLNLKIKIKYNDQHNEIEISPNFSILDQLKEFDIPYSCLNGVCSSCKCKLVSGEVDMKNSISLTNKEVESGFILSCQSYAKTDIEIDFDY